VYHQIFNLQYANSISINGDNVKSGGESSLSACTLSEHLGEGRGGEGILGFKAPRGKILSTPLPNRIIAVWIVFLTLLLMQSLLTYLKIVWIDSVLTLIRPIGGIYPQSSIFEAIL